MKITIDIPDELAPVVVRILDERHYDEDDGRTESYIMKDMDLSTEDFIKAENIADDIGMLISAKIEKSS